MKTKSRNVLLAAVAVVALTIGTSTPAFAASATGTRSCSAPKSVTLSSVMQGSNGTHSYLANGQTYFFINPNPGVAYFKQTYGAPLSTAWSIYSNGPLNYANAGCI
jgi:ABC-type sugar transport system substrate-binding protein